MTRYLLKIAYNGTAYHGWQLQKNARTVQEQINEALAIVYQTEIITLGCGRTDTGVHARVFFLHFDALPPIPENLLTRLNKILPADIRCYELFEVNSDFNARFDAISRRYEYMITRKPSPFLNNMVWFYPHSLEIKKMNEACVVLMKHQDFQCFSKVKTDVNNYICQITEATWVVEGDILYFRITANRFLRNMVRAIVGTMIEIGTGKTSLTKFDEILASKNRSEAGESVPASGLYLIDVAYPPETYIHSHQLPQHEHA